MKVLNSLYTSIPPSLEVPKNLGSYLKTYLSLIPQHYYKIFFLST